MNRSRKSDKFVVSKKPSNKTNDMVTERVERRDLPKENEQRQNMLRTQRREGVLNELLLINEQGTSQGSAASPLLANVFLHYVYDLWVHQWRKQKARGEVTVIRFADDTVVGFQYECRATA